MQSHVYRFPARVGQPVRWFLSSDLHLGSTNAMVPAIRREFDRAKKLNANILINGDVVDGIVAGDKRYLPGDPVPELERAKDANDALVKIIFETLKDYAELIKVIGIGNHEESWIKYYKADPVGNAIVRLNAYLAEKGHPNRIRHGGISGFVVSKLDVPSGQGKPLTLTHSTYYHHGAGGDAAVTKGMIAANRMHVGFLADCYTNGHRHSNFSTPDSVVMVRPNGRIVNKQIVTIQTGSYYRNLHQGKQEAPLDYSYGESKQHRQKPVGGMFLALTPERAKVNGEEAWAIRQDYHSPLLPMPAVA
jgi:UDP-2,3-diacylglucosamine pyrophosphatase LpxH